MELNFAQILRDMGDDAIFAIANEARPTGDYLFQTILPEIQRPNFNIESGSMTIRPTMAGLVGMNAPLPPTGAVTVSTFLAQTAKLGVEMEMEETNLRTLYAIVQGLLARGAVDTDDLLAEEVLNFEQGVLLQSMWDRSEWLRGRALQYGAIDWNFAGIRLEVNYGLPAGAFGTTRTIAGGTAYSEGTSAFWTDHRAAQQYLRRNVAQIIMHPDTFDVLIENPINRIEVIGQNADNTVFQIGYRQAGNEQLSTDTRMRAQIQLYALEGEVLNADGSTSIAPFMVPGKVLYLGRAQRPAYRVGMGARGTPEQDGGRALGYHHMAPTVEGGFRPGRYAKLWVPENREYTVRGKAVSNELPIIERQELIYVATTEMP